MSRRPSHRYPRQAGTDEQSGFPRSERSEAGDTLIEVLIALVIITLTAASLLSAFTTAISASAQHRNFATLDSVLKSFVEEVQYQLGQQTSTSPTFDVNCAQTLTAPYNTLTLTQGTNPVYTASLTGIQYWQSNNTWGNTCLTATPPQQQLLTATAVNQRTNQQDSVSFSISDPAYDPSPPSPPAWSGSFSDTVAAGGSYTYPVFATGSPTPSLTIPAQSPSAPSWVSLVDNGGGNGTLNIDPPSSTTPNTYSFQIAATNSYNGGKTTNQLFTVVVEQGPSITSANSDVVSPGTPFTWTVTTNGTPKPALTASGLPTSVSFIDNGNGTGTLSGTGSVAQGTYTITFIATNTVGSASQTFTLVVSSGTAPSFTSAASDTVPFDQSFTFNVTAIGAPIPAISAVSGVPSWATFTAGTGSATLKGTPNKSSQVGSYVITFSATNSVSTTLQIFTLTVNPQSTPTISTPNNASPACLVQNKVFTFTVTGTGFQNGVTATSTEGGLGASYVSSTTVTVTGTAGKTTGTFSFQLINPDQGTASSSSAAIKVVTSSTKC
jgi:Tfp pilus assembly protein PilV